MGRLRSPAWRGGYHAPAATLRAMGRGAMAVLFACSLVAGCTAIGSTDGLSSGGSPVDAGSSGSVDAPQGDAPGLDASDAGRFCERQSPKPVLCSDFDTDPLAVEWPTPTATGGGSVGADTSAFLSAPRALRVTTPPISDAGAPGRARLCAHFDPSRHVRISFGVRVVSVDPGAVVSLASLRFESANRRIITEIRATPPVGAWKIIQQDETTSLFDAPFAKSPVLSVWSRVTLDALLGSDAAGKTNLRTTVTLDDVVVATLEHDWPMSLTAPRYASASRSSTGRRRR